MPKRDINLHFEGEIPEWTERKHSLAARYFVPAAMKMKSVNGKVALVDGYAGPNNYGGEIRGSTAIMVAAARRVIAQHCTATVYACEPDGPRYESLVRNLADPIAEGILVPFNRTHAESVADIKAAMGNAAALVFLDPQTAAEMTLSDDIFPWADRKITDILGVFMGGQACRIVASDQTAEQPAMRASLGEQWRTATTENEAYRVFLESIGKRKRFTGLYRLRKQEPRQNAYGIFGMSDSPHGIWLLSEAIAKDWGLLKASDQSKSGPDLFTEITQEEEDQNAMEFLISVCRPYLKKDSTLRGDKLGIEAFKTYEDVNQLFGRFVGADYTKAAKAILGTDSKARGN